MTTLPPTADNGEPLVAVAAVQALRLDHRATDPYLRVGLIDRLVAAQVLLPSGMRFAIVHGYTRDGLTTCRVPPFDHHTTGGAVDLVVHTPYGREVWMGTEFALPDEEDLPPEATANREPLRRSLAAAGLVNHPTAWWHWSFGDHYWSHVVGAPARYGPAQAPSGPVDVRGHRARNR